MQYSRNNRGLVYDDVNGNGTQDAGEPGLSGVDVLITDEDGNAQTVTTDANGAYTATVVAAGDATVDIDETTLPTGAVQTEGTDPTTVTVVSGTTVPEEENGFNTPGTIEGLVYDDVNGNGTQDAGEPGLSGVDVLITDEDGNAQTVTTDANGAYTAIVVAAGDATVDIDETTLPTGAVQTEGTDPTTVTVVSGTTVPEEENGFNTPGTIEGLVYDDVNGNGTQDAGEPGLSGVDVLITDEDGNAQTVTTDANGAYTATVVAAGDATVDIDETTLPTGAVQTEGTDPTTVTVVSGTTVPEEENGFNTPGTIEGLVYDDVNGNGTQDAGEPGLSGVDVLITDEDGNAQTVTTDANGAYTAIVVAAGDATVDIDETTLPTGAVQTEGTDPTTVTVVSGTTVPEEENGIFTPMPNLNVVKAAGAVVDVNMNGINDEGDTITYSFSVTNNGNVEIRDVVINDALISLVNEPVTPSTLAIGDVGVISDQVYVITAAVGSGEAFDTIGNSAGPVSDDSDDPNNVTDANPDGDADPDDPTVVPLGAKWYLNGVVFDDANGNGIQIWVKWD
ncbi:SdrD B-like domain-containing protein [Nonlabens xylanidelens]|uniref:SdrD B-like domain-containing protein n=1 Tax=Nonlabens xylanidelens TaxID=191564 RepID=UPI0020122BD6|nr:SdrD B-like domain-containing protein [Nonlabens xylanidelens]